MEPFVCLRVPKIFNLRMDPYERADVGPTNGYYGWETENVYLGAEGVMRATQMLQTFKEYPPSQIPATFTIDQATDALKRELQQKQGK